MKLKYKIGDKFLRTSISPTELKHSTGVAQIGFVTKIIKIEPDKKYPYMIMHPGNIEWYATDEFLDEYFVCLNSKETKWREVLKR